MDREREPAPGIVADIKAAWRHAADEPVPGGARWSYVFGSILVLLLVVQVASGTLLAFEYAPTTASAHESLVRVMDPSRLPLGSIVRGLHHHGASFLVALLGLHVLQVALFGAYRPPRRLNWLTGLAAGGLLLALAFTGSLLPWDAEAFYATRVGLNIMRSAPVVGPIMADLLQGGPTLGNLTLTRFYTLHVVVLPALLAGLLLLHLALMRRHGVTPDPRLSENALRDRVDPFFPHQALKDLLAAFVVVILLLATCGLVPAPLGEKADPAVFLEARPQWYFWWLFQLLHHFEPPLEWLGTFGIPGLLVAFMTLLPWIDRAPDRGFRARRGPLAGVLVSAGLVAFLTGEVLLASLLTAPSPDAAPATTRAAGRAVTAFDAALIYGEKCTECHRRDGSPEDPDARDFRTPEFARMARADFEALVEIVRKGDDEGIMPAFEEELTDEEIRAVLELVVLSFARSPSAAGRPAQGGTGAPP